LGGDLIIGQNQASHIGTLVERTTGFVMLLHLPGDRNAATFAEAMTAKILRTWCDHGVYGEDVS
jgi:IS30 family transposase